MKRSRRNHILFLTRWYPHAYDPMFGLFVQRHAIAVGNFEDASVIYLHPVDDIEKTDIAYSETAGVLEIIVYYPRPKFKVFLPLGFLLAFRRAFKNLVSMKSSPDLIHVNILTRMGILALMMKVLKGIPYIITEHWSRYLPQNNSYKGRLRKRMTEWVVRKASAVTTVTDNLRQAMENRGLKNRNYRVVPNVVNVNFFKPSETKQGGSVKNLIHLSCFEERSKNMSGILRVIRRLSEKRSDFKLYMVGEGEDLEPSIAMAEKMGLKDEYVFFTGLKEGEELLGTMQMADLMVMFSHYENLPVVILEAFACGIPVISSDVGGIREHLTEERGKLIPPGDEEKFLTELDKILDRLDRFDSQSIRNYAIEHFSNETIGKQFDDIYRKVLNQHG